MRLLSFKSKAPKIPEVNLNVFSDGTASDIIILVLGRTGTGKSTFVNAVLNSNMMEVGHDLVSCTQTVQWGVIESVPNHPLLADQRLVMVDAPGFDDSNRTDVAILKEVSSWLEHSYSNNMKISGIVYLYDISRRFTDHDRKNRDIFEDVCGPDALKRVVMTSTKVDALSRSPEKLERREEQYKEKVWDHWMGRGAQVARFENKETYSAQEANPAAWVVIDQVLSTFVQSEVLLLQREMVDYHLPLGATTAGERVSSELLQALEDLGVVMASYTGGMYPQSPSGQSPQLQQLMDIEERLRESLKELKFSPSFKSRLLAKFTKKDSKK